MTTELSFTEENYLKAIYHLSNAGQSEVSTNSLADAMNTKPATASDMIKRLSRKNIISYQKYKGVNVSGSGQDLALKIIRKHRLWEVFLVDKLKFNWDEVHEIAEQLEHIKSPLLVERLDEFLGHPTVDPHGDPIPDKDGNFKVGPTVSLSEMNANETGALVKVGSDDPRLLQFLDKLNIRLGTKLKVESKEEFDGSMQVRIEEVQSTFLSEQISQFLLIRKIV